MDANTAGETAGQTGDAAPTDGARPDVVIVGGGLIGAAAGLALAQEGLASVILDPVPLSASMDAGFDGRAYAVALSSRRFLMRLGLWEALEPDAQPINDILVSDGRPGERAAPLFLHFGAAEMGPDGFGHLVEDHHLRLALLKAAVAEPLIDYRDGVSARLQDPDDARASVVAAAPDGTETLIHAPLVVGCDGRRSHVAERTGLRKVAADYDQVGLVCAVAHEKPHHGVAHEFFLPSGPFAILPLTGDRSSLVWTERGRLAEALRTASDAVYLSEIRRRMGDVYGRVELAGRRWTYPLSLVIAESFVGPRAALVGDAARGIHPIAGQGMNYGLRDAAALAEVLGAAARRGEDLGAPGVLRRYEQWRRPDSWAIALATDGLNRLFSNDLEPVRWARRLGLAAFGRVGPLRRAAMRFAAGDSAHLPASMRG